MKRVIFPLVLLSFHSLSFCAQSDPLDKQEQSALTTYAALTEQLDAIKVSQEKAPSLPQVAMIFLNCEKHGCETTININGFCSECVKDVTKSELQPVYQLQPGQSCELHGIQATIDRNGFCKSCLKQEPSLEEEAAEEVKNQGFKYISNWDAMVAKLGSPSNLNTDRP